MFVFHYVHLFWNLDPDYYFIQFISSQRFRNFYVELIIAE